MSRCVYLLKRWSAAGRDINQLKIATILEEMPAWSDPDIRSVPTDFTATDHLGTYEVFVGRINQKNQWRALANTRMDVRDIR